ncbi:TPA: hypothetical protein DCL28_02110 [Candidatus Komeilibacteria bacterium]|nr:MAG: hypothetical protein UW91_C0007G0003 [Parcubacteria group bacterium GW2011_GWF2_45_11]OGY94489.1 MAG: hypothetical protein A3J95_00315 [Candidatus Komeilibacteria bacterium RIFOXYC2_FULL_45_12]OGY94525.1 MAG: hypothetical protein A2260_00330 [Candidatus Komeilibacteria bacterium RIFOXYA2_FULL_45_9]HAH04333.1 hypothetical protein [Candidatus Komeilibacteria bacterium]
MRYVIGLLVIAVGFMLVWKADWIVNNFGRVNWAEKYLGYDGGSRLFWKLMGIVVIFLSMLYMFGFIGGLIDLIFSPLFRR